jgi:hypothetical protein
MILVGCDKKSAEYRRGYAQGAAEAKAEISSNAPTFYASGTHPVPVPKDFKDDETGLPITFIAGCLVNDADMGRQDGHNTAIREYLKKEKDAP